MELALRRHEADGHRWSFISRPPAPLLAGLVGPYVGYVERATRPVRRLELPLVGLPLIISLGPVIRLRPALEEGPWAVATSFVAGPHDRPTLTEFAGPQRGIQANFTPEGAALLLGRPLAGLVNRVVGIEELLGRAGRELGPRLAALPSWAARFAALDAWLLGRLAAARPPRGDLVWAMGELRRSGGAAQVAGLAAAIGCSRKHLTVRFAATFGLPPKRFARLVRFARATALLAAGGAMSDAGIAQDCGYADEAHLHRDCRTFAGLPPGALRRRLMPGGGGLAGG